MTAPIREPYRDLDAILRDEDFFVITTNQDTQFVKLYSEDMVAEIQGDTASSSVRAAAPTTSGMRLNPSSR